MGEYHTIDLGRIDLKSLHVAEKHVSVPPGIEEDRVLGSPNQTGKAPLAFTALSVRNVVV